MVAVATGFDAPIKLLMPHMTIDYPTTNCSLLGLGDIVIPGVYIGFLVRFGRVMTGDATQQEKTDDPVTKPTTAYRNAAYIAYFLALVLCGICLFLSHAAQPALLYIVPALYLATFAVGLCRGEIGKLKEGID